VGMTTGLYIVLPFHETVVVKHWIFGRGVARNEGLEVYALVFVGSLASR
jgi:hypothetical protein